MSTPKREVLSEQRVIERLRRLASGGKRNITPIASSVASVASVVAPIVGVGDDAAVVRAPRNHDLLVTTDLFVEGLHFRRGILSARSAGRRALGRALSDVAAMGGRPLWVWLSLALPTPVAVRWVFDFLAGFAEAARRCRVVLAGGDTGGSGSSVFLADVIVCGSVRRGRAILRSGARPGDVLFVSGTLGATAKALSSGGRLPEVTPRIELGQALSRLRIATAMIDLSDGLSTDLAHLAAESAAGAEVRADAIPRIGTLAQALNGGEDYELLFAVRPHDARRVPGSIGGVPLTPIGRMVRQRGIWIVDERSGRERLAPSGWQHRWAAETAGQQGSYSPRTR